MVSGVINLNADRHMERECVCYRKGEKNVLAGLGHGGIANSGLIKERCPVA